MQQREGVNELNPKKERTMQILHKFFCFRTEKLVNCRRDFFVAVLQCPSNTNTKFGLREILEAEWCYQYLSWRHFSEFKPFLRLPTLPIWQCFFCLNSKSNIEVTFKDSKQPTQAIKAISLIQQSADC